MRGFGCLVLELHHARRAEADGSDLVVKEAGLVDVCADALHVGSELMWKWAVGGVDGDEVLVQGGTR
jgi:hypothetical protein